jgi:hypothetical protein
MCVGLEKKSESVGKNRCEQTSARRSLRSRGMNRNRTGSVRAAQWEPLIASDAESRKRIKRRAPRLSAAPQTPMY